MFLDEPQFRKRKWEIICPEMSLTYGGAAGNRRTWDGSGVVRSTEAGGLEFRLITRDPYDFFSRLKRIAHGETGTLVKDDDFFNLEAIDVSGRSWVATRVSADENGGDHGTAWEGKLSEIRHADQTCCDGPALLSLAFYGKFDVPCNELSTTQRTVGQRTTEQSIDRNVARHQIGGYEVSAICEDDRLLLELQGGAGLGVVPLQLISRVEETLEFLYGQPMRAAIAEMIDVNGSVTSLRGSIPIDQGPNANPPVRIQRAGGNLSFWRLFDAFLGHIKDFDKGSSRPPLSRCVQHLLLNRVPLDTKALSWSTGVEALLNEGFEDISPDPAFLRALDELQEWVDRVPLRDDYQERLLAMTHSEGRNQCDEEYSKALDSVEAFITRAKLSSGIVKRLSGTIGAQRQASAKEKLKALQLRGAVTEMQIKDWQSVRHSLSHGKVHHLDDEFLRACMGVLTLAHCIIFHKIGYNGDFVNYGSKSWPIANYPFPCTTEASGSARLAAQSPTFSIPDR